MRCLYTGCWLNNIGHLLWEECQVIWGIQVHHSIILCHVPSTIPVKQFLFKVRGRDLVICAQGAICTLRWLSLLRRLETCTHYISSLLAFSSLSFLPDWYHDKQLGIWPEYPEQETDRAWGLLVETASLQLSDGENKTHRLLQSTDPALGFFPVSAFNTCH